MIAGSNQLFEAQAVEIHEEILHKIALKRIVAITVNHFPLKLIRIVLQFCLNLRQLCIELIILRSFRRTEIRIGHYNQLLSLANSASSESAAAKPQTLSCHELPRIL